MYLKWTCAAPSKIRIVEDTESSQPEGEQERQGHISQLSKLSLTPNITFIPRDKGGIVGQHDTICVNFLKSHGGIFFLNHSA